MKQNISHAVMSQRHEPADSRDDFPTPPWATRALFEHVLPGYRSYFRSATCLEPACGAGHMARVLEEYFARVLAYDAFDDSYGAIRNFLTFPYREGEADWIITNPPFRLAEDFIARALRERIARHGMAILARTVFLEGKRRYQQIFWRRPPWIVAQFVERVPMVRGRLDATATTATGYAWFVWKMDPAPEDLVPRLLWIPPCRRRLERSGDYPADGPDNCLSEDRC